VFASKPAIKSSAQLREVSPIADELIVGLKFRLSQQLPIFHGNAARNVACPLDAPPSSAAFANHALDQCRCYFHHDRQRMEDL